MNGDLADDDVHDDAEHGPPTLAARVRPGQTPAFVAVQDEQRPRRRSGRPFVRHVETSVVSNNKNWAQIHGFEIALCPSHC